MGKFQHSLIRRRLFLSYAKAVLNNQITLRNVTLKKKQLVDGVVKEFDLKPGKARTAVDLVLSELLKSSQSEEGFSSSILNIKVDQREGKTIQTHEGEKYISGRKVAIMQAAGKK